MDKEFQIKSGDGHPEEWETEIALNEDEKKFVAGGGHIWAIGSHKSGSFWSPVRVWDRGVFVAGKFNTKIGAEVFAVNLASMAENKDMVALFHELSAPEVAAEIYNTTKIGD